MEQEDQLATEKQWTGRTRGGYLGNYIFVTLVRYCGLGCAYLLLLPVVFYFLFFAPKALRASEEYRRRRGLRSSFLFRFWYGYKHFFSFGQILLDRVAIISKASSKFKFSFQGEEHIAGALAGGKGMVLISAHCGNWEIAAHLLKNFQATVNVVAYQGEVAYIRKYFAEVLKDRSFSLIEMDGSSEVSLKILSALSRGEIVAMHGDRVLGPDQKHLEMEFLGAPARFPTGPYLVAAIAGAPLVHSFAMREGLYRYRLFAYPPEVLSLGKRSERPDQLGKWVGLFVSRLEETLKKYPFQWHNFYPFWTTRKNGFYP